MSRTRRVIERAVGASDPWAVVDAWAREAVDPVALRARWSARAVPIRGVDRLVDVTGDRDDAAAALRAAGLAPRPLRPARRSLGRTGDVAYRPDQDVIDALLDAGVAHRVVSAARRYVWRGPLAGPTFCEISTEAATGVVTVEAWHEPVWTDSFRLGAGTEARRRPRRVQQARAAINRLLDALDADAIPAAED